MLLKSIEYYSTASFATSNENNRQEISLTKNRALWQWIFNRPAKTFVFELYFGKWYNKVTGERVSTYDEVAICSLRDQIQYLASQSKR